MLRHWARSCKNRSLNDDLQDGRDIHQRKPVIIVGMAMMAIEVRSFTMLPGMVGAEAPISVKIAGQVFAILITCPFSMLSSEEVGFARIHPGRG